MVGLLVALGCDDGGRNSPDLGIPDLKPPPPDMAKVFDLANLDFKGVGCGNMTCSPTETCCVTPVGAAFQSMCRAGTSCGSGSAAALCDGPEDCMNGEGCCAQVVFDVPDGGGTGPMPQSGMAGCGAMCPAEVLGGGLNRTDFKSKLCHSPTDCAEYYGEIFGGMVKFDGCCSRPEVKFKFCAPDDQSYKTAGGYTCL
jgi:hypothetical protein